MATWLDKLRSETGPLRERATLMAAGLAAAWRRLVWETRRAACWLLARLCDADPAAASTVSSTPGLQRRLQRMETRLVDVIGQQRRPVDGAVAHLQQRVDTLAGTLEQRLPSRDFNKNMLRALQQVAHGIAQLQREPDPEPEPSPDPVPASSHADSPAVASGATAGDVTPFAAERLRRVFAEHGLWNQERWLELWRPNPDVEALAEQLLDDWFEADADGTVAVPTEFWSGLDQWLREQSRSRVGLYLPEQRKRWDRERQRPEYRQADKVTIGQVIAVLSPGLEIDGELRSKARVEVSQ